jgi:Phage integrase, N-terminal SAM-like domain
MTEHSAEPTFDTRFWQSYSECLVRLKIAPRHHRWYKNWCQKFIKFMSSRPTSECQPEHVSAFLNNLRDQPDINDPD